MNRTVIMNAVNEIIKDYREGVLEKIEAKERLEGIMVLINHSEIERSSERMEIKKEIKEKWEKVR